MRERIEEERFEEWEWFEAEFAIKYFRIRKGNVKYFNNKIR